LGCGGRGSRLVISSFGSACRCWNWKFLAVRSRPNTVAAVAYDPKVFFTVVGKPPGHVVAADVLACVAATQMVARAVPETTDGP
jgi:hypothetical protein